MSQLLDHRFVVQILPQKCLLLLVLNVKLVKKLLPLQQLELTTNNIGLGSRVIIKRLRKALLLLDRA
jgi:hypothetical protein